jgi:membrane protease YdiL (CAAX protease family)
MWRNSLSKLVKKPAGFKPWMALLLPVWVFVGFIAAQVVAQLLILLLEQLGVSFKGVDPSTFQTAASAVIYLLSLSIVIGLPWAVKKYKTSRQELGIIQPLTWTDLLLAPAAFIVYILISFVLTSLASYLPFFNSGQVQNTGFTGLSQGFEYVLAFVTLVIIAPISEEVLFRGYLLGKLRKYVPIWAAILVTSLLFAVVHFQFNVGVDVFALSIVLCLLRVGTGRLWPSILLHMIKNGIAFYFLFINPGL